MNHSFFTYILSLSDNTYYIGYTVNLSNRLIAHNDGTAAKRTKGRRAVLVYYECFKTKSKAMSREVALKKLSRSKKTELIENKNFSIID